MTDTQTATTVADLSPDLTVSQIVALWPKALPVLHRLGLDTCCGGAHPLRMVADRHGLDLDSVLAELREALHLSR